MRPTVWIEGVGRLMIGHKITRDGSGVFATARMAACVFTDVVYLLALWPCEIPPGAPSRNRLSRVWAWLKR